MSAPDESLVPAITPPSSTLATNAQSAAAVRTLDAGTINETLEDVVGKMQKLKEIATPPNDNNWYAQAEAGMDTHDTGWWEAYAHGLVRALDGDFHLSRREQDKGFYDKLRTVLRGAPPEQLIAKYLELEEDFLRFDEKGVERQYDPHYPQPIDLGGLTRTQSLSLRVIAFSLLRAQLASQGFELPENPVMAEAVAAVQEGILRFSNPTNRLALPLGNAPDRLEERPKELE